MKYKYKNIEINIIELCESDIIITSGIFDVSNPLDPGVKDPYF